MAERLITESQRLNPGRRSTRRGTRPLEGLPLPYDDSDVWEVFVKPGIEESVSRVKDDIQERVFEIPVGIVGGALSLLSSLCE